MAKTSELYIDGKRTSATLTELYKDASKLRNILKNLDPNSDKVEAYRKKFDKVQERVEDVKGELGLVRKKTEQATQSAGTLGKGFGKAGQLMKAAFAATGLLALIDNVAALVQGLFEMGKTSVAVRADLQKLTGETGEDLDALTGKVQAFADRTGKDAAEAVGSLNAASKSFGDDYVDSLDKINKANALLVDGNEEFLDVVKEYSPLMNEAGYSAEEFYANLIKAERAGAQNLDKAADFYKEFGIRIREQTKATGDAVGLLGADFRDKLFAGLEDGSLTSQDALQQIVNRIEETGTSGKNLGTIMADVFGSQAEDLGENFLKSLNDSSATFDELVAGADEYTKAQFRMQAAQEGFYVLIGQIADGVKTFFASVVNNADPVIEVFSEIWEQIKLIWNQVSNLIKQTGLFNTQGGIMRKVMEGIAFVMKAGTTIFMLYLKAINFLIQGFVSLYNSSENFRKGFLGVAKAIGGILTGIKNAFLDTFKGIGDVLTGIVDRDFEKIKSGLAQAGGGLKDYFFEVGNNAAKGFAEGWASGADSKIDYTSIVPDLGSGDTTSPTQEQNPTGGSDFKFSGGNRVDPLEELKDQQDAVLKSKNSFTKDFIQIEKERNQRYKDILKERRFADQDYADFKKNLMIAEISATSDLFGGIADLLSTNEKAQKKHADKIKALKIVEVTLAGIAEVQKIWSAYASTPYIGPVIAGIQTAIAVGRTVAATQKIAKTKYATGGQIKGPSHAGGGVPFTINGHAGFEAEGDEFITRKAATANNLGALDTINRFGDRFKFQVYPMLKYATGGVTPSVPATTSLSQPATPGTEVMEDMMMAMIDSINAVGEKLDNYEREKEIALKYTDIEDTSAKVATVRAE